MCELALKYTVQIPDTKPDRLVIPGDPAAYNSRG